MYMCDRFVGICGLCVCTNSCNFPVFFNNTNPQIMDKIVLVTTLPVDGVVLERPLYFRLFVQCPGNVLEFDLKNE